MKRTFGLAWILLSLLTGCEAARMTPIRLGGLFDLSEGMAALDVPASEGARLAVKELNEAGGVLGGPVDLVTLDTHYDKEKTQKAAEQLIRDEQVVSVVGFDDTDSVLWSGPIIDAASIPFVTVGATSPELPSQVGPMMFLACFGDNVQAAAGAQFGAEKFGTTTYILWDSGTHYTELLRRYFKETFEMGLKGTVLGDVAFSDTQSDFSAEIAAIKALPQAPKFLYIAAMPYNIGPITKQLREAGIMLPIVGGDGYDDPTWIATVGTASENVYFTTHAFVDSAAGSDRMKRFLAAYAAIEPKQAASGFAALGYDAVHLVANAIKRANSTDGSAIKQALENTSGFSGVSGTISLSAESHVPAKGVTVIGLAAGKYTLAGEFVPKYIPAPPR